MWSWTYLCLSLYWRIQVLQVEWDEGCPWVYSTYRKPGQKVLWRGKARYQIACSWFFSSVSADFFSMNLQAIFNSSVEPDSKPWESWKIKLLPGYVIWCPISCRPLCYHCVWLGCPCVIIWLTSSDGIKWITDCLSWLPEKSSTVNGTTNLRSTHHPCHIWWALLPLLHHKPSQGWLSCLH